MQDDHLIQTFTTEVLSYYEANGRHDLPWRRYTAAGTLDPYAVLVSELMLQQTQVPRVIPKFEAFMVVFPTVQDLAEASLADVIRMWSGLGYNRRAKFLWQAAGKIVHDYAGKIPETLTPLVSLPGVGPNTAGAILAYAYNQPVAYVETNIRSVFIHHFFPDREAVADTELMPLIQASIPPGRAREWYWALMDYGSHLKQSVGNTARASKTYTKQSAFHGSRRKVRGIVLKSLSVSPATRDILAAATQDERLDAVLADLVAEGFIVEQDGQYMLHA